MSYLFTSESVAPGHPDKMADQISDAILDRLLEYDPHVRAAIETLVTTGLVVVSGEVTTHNDKAAAVLAGVEGIVRDTVKSLYYDDPASGFDYRACAVISTIHPQSPDISRGVSVGEGLHDEQGAGDQGIMFGYACDETDALMPLPIHLAQRMMWRFWDIRTNPSRIANGSPIQDGAWLRSDGKCQVTVEYDGDKPVRLDTIVLSVQHTDLVTDGNGNLSPNAREFLIMNIVEPSVMDICPDLWSDSGITFHINPTGRFVVGGPHGDCGLTGRKIIVDTYGGMARHGGGAFSGKDPSKVDRSAAYMARYIAKNIVVTEFVTHCEVQLAYAIGVAEPVSVMVDTFGTANTRARNRAGGRVVFDEKMAEAVRRVFPLTPRGIITKLDLRHPMFAETARFGHFGNPDFSWEKTDMRQELEDVFT